ncbi:hypothetical protein C0989_001408 [Termitomyces sp. Mn162]|nr:hypothetical protein C0989_001408 [Termitomyces sp. Mn162]
MSLWNVKHKRLCRSPYDDPVDPLANGTFSNLEPDANDDIFGTTREPFGTTREPSGTPEAPVNGIPQEQEEEEEEEEVELGDESDEDVEIIMEAAPRSIDFRYRASFVYTQKAHQYPGKELAVVKRQGQSARQYLRNPEQSLLTTEYTPISRGGPPEAVAHAPRPNNSQTQSHGAGTSFASPSHTHSQVPGAQSSDAEAQPKEDDGIDTSTLPPVTAPPSHPVVDPTATGVMDGRSILDFDLGTMAEKPWRRPGSDISDWFNYGFDEISWEAYCYRRRDLGELANVLKTNVINFAGMQEEQITALPPEVRQMVMTGANAMMNGAANTGMMGPGVMMDMSGMMGPMGMGMDMGMGGGMMQMQPDGTGQMQQGVTNGTPEQSAQGNVSVGMIQDAGFNGQQQGDMMGMGMGNEYGMQQQAQMGQPMYQGMDGPQQVVAPAPGGRGASPAAYRGRAQGMSRGRGFSGRGRGRGGFGDGPPPPVPVRPASPLPPGVPTGPRNQNKYKDRDGNAPAVDGLDYGGTNKDLGMGRTSSGEPDERSMSRKRRSSPGMDDSRSSKRR